MFPTRNTRANRAVIECCQPGAGHVLEGIHTLHERRQQHALYQPVVVLEAAQTFGDLLVLFGSLLIDFKVDLVLLLQHRQQFVLIEILGVLEIHLHHVGKRIVTVVSDHVP